MKIFTDVWRKNVYFKRCLTEMIFKWHSYSIVSKLPYYRRLIRPYSTVPANSWPDDAKPVRLGLVQYLWVRLGLVQYPRVRTLSYFKPICSRFTADFRYGGTCGTLFYWMRNRARCANILKLRDFILILNILNERYPHSWEH